MSFPLLLIQKSQECSRNFTSSDESSSNFNEIANNVCRRLNGVIMSVFDEDNDRINKSLSNYILTRNSGRIVNDNFPVCIWVAPKASEHDQNILRPFCESLLPNDNKVFLKHSH